MLLDVIFADFTDFLEGKPYFLGQTKYLLRTTRTDLISCMFEITPTALKLHLQLLKIDMLRYLAIWVAVWATVDCGYEAAPYADWAHDHVVWLNGQEQDQAAIEGLVRTYQSYGIPVGGVNIDSGWSTCYNNFEFNAKKFPNPQGIVEEFHKQNIKVILWATSLVNSQCSIYQEGVDEGYFLNKGQLVKWWHGHGAFLDFTNPKAKQWWFKLMDRALDMGFDGWKTDGADPLILLLKPFPYSNWQKRPVGIHEYGHQYYGSFYNHTKARNPNALIMSRPVDSFKNKLFLAYSPKYVMFSGWVGDQDSSAAGFQEAMVNVLHSASKGYLSFGFDIGGYRGQNISKNIYIRWVQAGALMPFMENGGNGKHQPWKFDSQTVGIYRQFTLLHMSLKSFFLSSGSEAYSKKVSIIQPLVIDKRMFELSHSTNLGFVLWNTFLVYPIVTENSLVEISFPAGHDWVYYFNHSKIFQGGTDAIKAFPLNETALFFRTNSIVFIGDELHLVHLEPGLHRKSILHGEWSEEIVIQCTATEISLRTTRFYRDGTVAKRQRIAVRLMGLKGDSIKVMGNEVVRVHESEAVFQVSSEEVCLISL